MSIQRCLERIRIEICTHEWRGAYSRDLVTNMKSSVRQNPSSPRALGRLAKALTNTSDRKEAARIKEQLTRGFYRDGGTDRRREVGKEKHTEPGLERAARVR